MITMEQAEEAVNKRLEGLMPPGEYERCTTVDDAALVCSGTNILGPELVERLKADTFEVIVRLASSSEDEDVPAVIVGALMRVFWLGYAYGKEDGDA